MLKKVGFDWKKEFENFVFDKYIFIFILVLFIASWIFLIVILDIFIEVIVIFFFSMYGLLQYIKDFQKKQIKEGVKK